MTESKYAWSGRNLSTRMKKILMPSIITALATTINEVADSIIVANLLGNKAFTVLNLCFCITLLYTSLQVLIGYGGVIVYARYAGAKENRKAKEVFSSCFFLIGLISFAVTAAGMIFRDQIAGFLCVDAALLEDLKKYLIPLLISGPLMNLLITVSFIFPVIGKPRQALSLIISACVLNLVLDFVFIKCFGMGAAGAGWADVADYALPGIALVILLLMKKYRMPLSFRLFRNLKEFKPVLLAGLPFALFEFCPALLNIYFNHAAAKIGGPNVLTAYALQSQIQTFVSIVISSILGTAAPFLAVLHAEGDNNGIRYIMRKSSLWLICGGAAFALVIGIFPRIPAALFGVTDPEILAIALPAIRIFALTYLFRGINILMRNYMNACGYDYYAMGITVADGLIGIVFWTLILAPAFGLNGLWLSYPVNALVLMAGIFIINAVVAKAKKDRRGALWLKQESDLLSRMTMTIEDRNEVISDVSKKIRTFCYASHIPADKGFKAGLLTEEMCLFAVSQNEERLFIDISLKVFKDRIQLDFRYLGIPADPLLKAENELTENLKILKGLPSEIKYNYSLGMNSTRILL